MVNRLWEERNEITETLSKRERRILHDYERENGKVMPGAIYKVIQDQMDIANERRGRKAGKNRK